MVGINDNDMREFAEWYKNRYGKMEEIDKATII